MLLIQVNVSDFHLPWNVFQIYTRLSQWLCQANKPCSKDVIKEYQIIYLCKNKKWHTQWWQNIVSPAFANDLPLQPAFFFPFRMKDYYAGLFSYFLKASEHYIHTYIFILFCAEKAIEHILFHSISFDISKVKGLYVYICLIIESIGFLRN